MQKILDFLGNNEAFHQGLLLSAYMAAGGLLSLFVGFLFRTHARTVSGREAFSANFPLVTMATVLVIFVVKSSLALSLGLVGALSIVRFRAAIKEPEEIVYLFFCIAQGLALGAEHPWLAAFGTIVFGLFVALHARLRGAEGSPALLLTIAGGRKDALEGDAGRLAAAVEETLGACRIQRFDVEDGRVQFRATVAPAEGGSGEVAARIAGLAARLPACRISYVNLEESL